MRRSELEKSSNLFKSSVGCALAKLRGVGANDRPLCRSCRISGVRVCALRLCTPTLGLILVCGLGIKNGQFSVVSWGVVVLMVDRLKFCVFLRMVFVVMVVLWCWLMRTAFDLEVVLVIGISVLIGRRFGVLWHHFVLGMFHIFFVDLLVGL